MSEYTLKDIPQLREEIAELFSDLLGPLPLELPPLHEVLHEIPLMDESKQLKHRLLGAYMHLTLNTSPIYFKLPLFFLQALVQNTKHNTTIFF